MRKLTRSFNEIVDNQKEIRTRYLPNTSLGRYCYITLPGVLHTFQTVGCDQHNYGLLN